MQQKMGIFPPEMLEDCGELPAEATATCGRALQTCQEHPLPKAGTRALMAAMVVASLVAAGCSAKVEAPVQAPAPVWQEEAADAAIKRFAKASGGQLGFRMGASASPQASAWETLRGENRKEAPQRDWEFALGKTWGEFMDGAARLTGREQLDWVNTHWGCVDTQQSWAAGDATESWTGRAAIVRGDGLLLSHSMRAGQASIAAAKVATLEELGWPASKVWVAAYSVPTAGGSMFFACAEDPQGRVWAMPSKRNADVLSMEAAGVSRLLPGAMLETVFCGNNAYMVMHGDSFKPENLPGTAAWRKKSIVKDIRRLAGRQPLTPPMQAPDLVMEPGKPISMQKG